ncbi:MAG TPA: acyltransferase family protein, partial [Hyphomonadaceae bacterium]|nr:acyltransferase family protein [Hyphomonadaceae bacterium]
MSADSNIRRLQSLDSLRGVAALIVVFYHMVGALPAPFASLASAPWRPLEGLPGWMVTLRYATAWIPLRLLWGGGYECVLLFFVLSGYVLSLPYLAGKSPSWTRYIGKRLCRLYLPSIAAILFALAMRAIAINGTYTFTPEWPWAAPLTPSLIWNNVLFLGGGDSFHLDGTIWSLVHEMRISIIFPFLFLIVLRTPALLSYATSALLALWAFHFVPTIGADTPLAQAERSWADTSGYVFYFVLGIVAARYHQKIG